MLEYFQIFYKCFDADDNILYYIDSKPKDSFESKPVLKYDNIGSYFDFIVLAVDSKWIDTIIKQISLSDNIKKNLNK